MFRVRKTLPGSGPERAPLVPRGLLEYVEALFPDRLPDLPDGRPTDPQQLLLTTAAAVGAQRVVRLLRRLYEEQNPDVG